MLLVEVAGSNTGQLERARAVILRHMDLNELKNISRRELLALAEVEELSLGVDGEGTEGTLLSTELLGKVKMSPGLNVVILGLPAVNETLNGVTVVADDEDDGSELAADHSGDLLDSELERTVTNEEDSTARNATILDDIAGSKDSTLASTDGVTDGTPQDLRDVSGTTWEASLPDTEVGSTSLSENDIVLTEPLADSGPQPGVSDGRRHGGLLVLGDDVGKLGLPLDIEVTHALDDAAENTLHADTGVVRVTDSAVVGVEVDGVHLSSTVGETAGVEVRLDATNGENQVRSLELLTDTLLGTVTSIDTTEVGESLINSTLTHGGNEGGEARLLDELVNLIKTSETDGTSVNKDDGVLGLLERAHDNVSDVLLSLRVVDRGVEVERSTETRAINRLSNHISRKQEIDGAGLEPALSESSIDLNCGLVGVVEVGRVARDTLAHLVENVEVTVTKGVVKKSTVLLGAGVGSTDDVNNGDELRVGTGDTVESRELTNTEGGDDGTHTLNTAIGISSVTWMDY